MKIVIVTHYNFGNKPSGAMNRVIELANAMSRYASIDILHQGIDLCMGHLRFIGYKSKFNFNRSHSISIAVKPYISYAFPDFYRAIKEVIDEADIVQVEQPYLFMPTLMVMKALNKKSFVALDEHNVDFIAVKSKINGISINSFLTAVTLPYVFLLEKLAVKNADLVLCVSHEDQELLMRIYGVTENKLHLVPNGLNLSKFEKAPLINDPMLENNAVFFHGTLSWYPNLEAANIIVDYLAPKMSDVTFLIAGLNPPASLIKKINKTNNVKYLGFLNNLEGWIKSSDVCIAPIFRGGGTRLKVLEYAAAGKPVVATYKAIEGLDMVNNVHGLFYEDVNEDFVSGIRLLLNDNQLAQELGRNAKQLAKKYDWHLIGKELYKTYLNFVGYAT